jgi:hypothetical protein
MRFHDVTSLVNESAPDYVKPVIPLREYSQRRTGTLRAPREFLSTTSKPLAVVGMTSRLEEPSGSGDALVHATVGPPVHFTACGELAFASR